MKKKPIERLIDWIFGLLLVALGAHLMAMGGTYHGYPLPRPAGVFPALMGALWIIFSKKTNT
jgi:hypothetical protein